MDYSISKSQKEIRKAAIDFAKGEFEKPLALEMEQNRIFPDEIYQKACELGFVGLNIPEKYEGAGLSTFENVLVAEAFCTIDSSIGSALMLSTYAAECLLRFGDESLKQAMLPKIVQGRLRCGLALKETVTGTKPDCQSSYAARKDDGWVLNGAKTYVINGGRSGLFVVLVPVLNTSQDELQSPLHHTTMFLVESDRKGIAVSDLGHKTGLNMLPLADVAFKDVYLPEDHLMGREGQGEPQIDLFFNESRIHIAAMALGVAQGALDRANIYIKARAQFGRKLSRFQVTRHKIAEMAAKIDTARFHTYHAAHLFDHSPRRPETERVSCMAKWLASRAAVEVTDEALQLFGGYGYMTEYEIERFFRDAKALEIFGETPQILKDKVARHVIGREG